MLEFIENLKPNKFKLTFTLSFAFLWYFLMNLIVDLNCRIESTTGTTPYNLINTCGDVSTQILIIYYMWFMIPIFVLYLIYSIIPMIAIDR